VVAAVVGVVELVAVAVAVAVLSRDVWWAKAQKVVVH